MEDVADATRHLLSSKKVSVHTVTVRIYICRKTEKALCKLLGIPMLTSARGGESVFNAEDDDDALMQFFTFDVPLFPTQAEEQAYLNMAEEDRLRLLLRHQQHLKDTIALDESSGAAANREQDSEPDLASLSLFQACQMRPASFFTLAFAIVGSPSKWTLFRLEDGSGDNADNAERAPLLEANPGSSLEALVIANENSLTHSLAAFIRALCMPGDLLDYRTSECALRLHVPEGALQDRTLATILHSVLASRSKDDADDDGDTLGKFGKRPKPDLFSCLLDRFARFYERAHILPKWLPLRDFRLILRTIRDSAQRTQSEPPSIRGFFNQVRQAALGLFSQQRSRPARRAAPFPGPTSTLANNSVRLQPNLHHLFDTFSFYICPFDQRPISLTLGPLPSELMCSEASKAPYEALAAYFDANSASLPALTANAVYALYRRISDPVLQQIIIALAGRALAQDDENDDDGDEEDAPTPQEQSSPKGKRKAEGRGGRGGHADQVDDTGRHGSGGSGTSGGGFRQAAGQAAPPSPKLLRLQEDRERRGEQDTAISAEPSRPSLDGASSEGSSSRYSGTTASTQDSRPRPDTLLTAATSGSSEAPLGKGRPGTGSNASSRVASLESIEEECAARKYLVSTEDFVGFYSNWWVRTGGDTITGHTQPQGRLQRRATAEIAALIAVLQRHHWLKAGFLLGVGKEPTDIFAQLRLIATSLETDQVFQEACMTAALDRIGPRREGDRSKIRQNKMLVVKRMKALLGCPLETPPRIRFTQNIGGQVGGRFIEPRFNDNVQLSVRLLQAPLGDKEDAADDDFVASPRHTGTADAEAPNNAFGPQVFAELFDFYHGRAFWFVFPHLIGDPVPGGSAPKSSNSEIGS